MSRRGVGLWALAAMALFALTAAAQPPERPDDRPGGPPPGGHPGGPRRGGPGGPMRLGTVLPPFLRAELRLTSEQEKEYLRKTLPVRRGWLGGFQDTQAPDYAEPAGGWRWVTGEKWNYTYWARGEPNEFVPGENFLEIDPSANSPDRCGWNDVPDDWHSNEGYYVEYPVPAGPKGK